MATVLKKAQAPAAVHPTILQLCRIIASANGPFRRAPPPGHLRGIDVYSAAQLPVVLRNAADSFHKALDRYPDIVAPERMSDKMFASKFLRPFKVPESGNKLLTSAFIPDEVKDLVTVAPIVWHSKVAKIPRGDALEPGVYYLKTSHGCNMYRRVTYPISDAEADALDAQFGQMLATRYGMASGNWWHSRFQPELMIEKSVGSTEFSTSFNYYVIDGKVELLVPFQKLRGGYRKTYFTADFERLPEDTPADAEFTMPSDATKALMLKLALAIGGPLGFARVDFLLDDDERPYLGEVTFTPGNAQTHISDELDLRLGRAWKWVPGR